MTQLPPEIIAEDILTRLPVKSLVRFRCVSKSWYSLICSSRFIKSHLAKSMETKSYRQLILHNRWKLCSFVLDSPDSPLELDHPLKCSDFQTTVMGSCNGLLLLCNVDVLRLPSFMSKDMPDLSPFYENMYHPDQNAIIWNPSTRRYQRLPYAPTEYPFNSCRPKHILYGFGYDSVSDDYKVVKMMQFDGIAKPGYYNSVVKIYSLKLNKWKNIERCPYQFAYENACGEFAGGALHWVMKVMKSDGQSFCFVAALDLATEKFRVVPLPDFSEMNFYTHVGVLGGSFSIFRHHPSSARMDVWIMQDYGVKESWTTVFSFWQTKDIDDYKLVRPLAISKSGREALLVHENKRLSWYDIEGKVCKDCKDIDMRCVKKHFNSLVCVQSLVQLPHEVKLGEEKILPKKKTEDRKDDDKNLEDKKKEEKQDENQKKTVKKRDNFLSKSFKLKL